MGVGERQPQHLQLLTREFLSQRRPQLRLVVGVIHELR